MLKAESQIGPYTLIKQLGKGAFGVVWLAEKRTAIATSQVAIKIALDEEPDLEAIKQEASLWAQIGGHPNVLPMIEANIYDGQVVIVSEYAPDNSLESWLKINNGKAPTIEQAVNITLGILSGLEHLHSRKVLHRDLKPANILLQGETPRLADFGLSRILKTTAQSTKASGTPAYMSPEAFDGKKVLQSDIWAAGIIFYQLLIGNLPFPAKDYSGLIGAIMLKDPEPLPKGLNQFTPIITKALQKNPDERYKSTSLMKTDLQNALKPAKEPEQPKKVKKANIAPNTEIGPYTLVKLLGNGQFGMVWLAEKRTAFATTQVALKLPLGEATDLEVIKQEASVWAAVGTHPNIVPILEANIYDEQIVIACEYVADGTLADYLAANGGKCPSLESAISITKGILSGLEHLHSKKIVHRDLKPANILLQGETPRLADFGLARILKTYHSGIAAGSPAYMSPEAFNGERFEQTDLWAVGVIFYQMLVGKMPFPQQNMGALIKAISLDTPESLPTSISKGLQEIINRVLEKEPSRRYKSAKEMKTVLELNGNPIKATPKVEPVTEAIKPSQTAKSNWEQATLPKTEVINSPANLQPKKTIGILPVEPKNNSKYIVIATSVVVLIIISYLGISRFASNNASTTNEQNNLPTNNSSTSTPTNKPATTTTNTKSFEFETVKVDATGKIVERTKKTANQYIEDLGNSIKLEMVEIPSGTFTMGSPSSEANRRDDEGPQHQVNVESFYLGKYEVTQAQYQAIMGNNPSNFKGDNLPVERVTWNEAIEFCEKLSAKTGKTYRLPSEAEWEYAARAGTTTPFAFGETINPRIVNYDGNYPYGQAAKGEYREKTIAVGSLGVANAFGLYDCHGNVWEWCQDIYQPNYNNAPTNGSAREQATDNNSRLLRGGSWDNDGGNCRSANRYGIAPGARDTVDVGFRVVLVGRTLK